MSQVNNSNTNTKSWWLIGAATLTALATTGYLAYGYSTGWKGPAYDFWCPKNRQRTLKSAY